MHDTVAAAAGYVDDAAEALAEGSVYVSREVGDAGELENALEQQIGDASVGVAVFSDNAALEASGPEIVAQLAQQTGYDTIIVAVGDDLSAGSRALDSGEAMRIANEAESSADSLEGALTETVQTVLAESAPAPVVEDPGAGGLIIGVGVAAAVVVAGVLTIVGVRRARSRASEGARGIPPAIRAKVQALGAERNSYAAAAAAGLAGAGEVAQDIDAIAANVTHLFTRLDKKGAEDQRHLAETEYGDKLGKLAAALDRDYLLDILTNPHLWDDPADRAREVRDAVDAVSEQLIENIKQVNARRALHFQVSLDTLIGRRKELQDWDREFHRTADGGEPPAS
ncbi:MAG TPA: hypothetical protein VNT50_02970 [Microbacterium sp.]|uniref:hypothetical protein n=1 Tax=Microbacterium sp. TaxID=51671 RepID=UPI002CB587E7|nr:hypothetical protein [Microbacterium sp.]HWI30424.1 hypothetical protein [Microbacterium sp.]